MKNTSITKTFQYNSENYKIYKNSSRAVYVKKETDGTWDFVSAKGIIRKKLAEINPDKYSLEETKKPNHNTQSLGAKLIKLLD